MRLSDEVAASIVEKVRSILKKELALTDDEGVIRAATNPVQAGLLHPLAERVLRDPKTVVVEKEEADHYQDMSPSVLYPLWYEGELLGVFVLEGTKREYPQAVLKLAQGLAEVVIYQRQLAATLESKEEAQAKFIRRLLSDEFVRSFEEVYPEADVLRINLRKKYAVCYIRIHQLKDVYLDQNKGKRRVSFERFLRGIKDQVTAALGDRSAVTLYDDRGTFIVLYDVEEQRLPRRPTRFYKKFVRKIFDELKKIIPGRVTIGIGGYYPGLDGLRKSYREAKLACEVGAKIRGRDNVYHIYDVGMFVAMTNISAEDKLALAEQILQPLLENPELLRTITTFLDHGMNLTDAAAALHIHRNTLIYRLDKIEELIALDPRRFDDALQIKLGLMIYQTAQLV